MSFWKISTVTPLLSSYSFLCGEEGAWIHRFLSRFRLEGKGFSWTHSTWSDSRVGEADDRISSQPMNIIKEYMWSHCMVWSWISSHHKRNINYAKAYEIFLICLISCFCIWNDIWLRECLMYFDFSLNLQWENRFCVFHSLKVNHPSFVPLHTLPHNLPLSSSLFDRICAVIFLIHSIFTYTVCQ